jgi:hypothetical protein
MDAFQAIARHRVTVGWAALSTVVTVCIAACGVAPAQNAPRSSTSAAADSVDRALDQIDAARHRLATADSAVASAMREMDDALAAAAQLAPGDHDGDLSSSVEQLERESRRMSQRWHDEGSRWQEAGSHWADFGQRIAFHAQALARREALRAQREAERDIERDVDHDDDSIDQDRHDREHEHGARRCDDDD